MLVGIANGKINKPPAGYQNDFEQAPGSLTEELSDDDSEDIGKTRGFDGSMNYDDEAENEMISLDQLTKP